MRSESVEFRHNELDRRLEIGKGCCAYLSIERHGAAGTNAIILKSHHIKDPMSLLEAAADE
jgi:hypothetical protein